MDEDIQIVTAKCSAVSIHVVPDKLMNAGQEASGE